MEQTLVNDVKKRLLKEKAVLVKELGRFAKPDARIKEHFHTKFPDMTDKLEESATEVSQFGDELALEQNLEETLKNIDHALDRIEKGMYGVCEVCGAEINPKRLEANVYATTCVEHAK